MKRYLLAERWTTARLPAMVGLLLLTACGDGSVDPGTLHFGQVGEVEVRVATPLNGAIGRQRQQLTWESSGAWQLFEEIGYQGVVGDDTTTPNPGVPELFRFLLRILHQRRQYGRGLATHQRRGPGPLRPTAGVRRDRKPAELVDSGRREKRDGDLVSMRGGHVEVAARSIGRTGQHRGACDPGRDHHAQPDDRRGGRNLRLHRQLALRHRREKATRPAWRSTSLASSVRPTASGATSRRPTGTRSGHVTREGRGSRRRWTGQPKWC